MNVVIKKGRHKTLLQIGGDLTIYTVGEVFQEISAVEGLFSKALAVDLSAVSEIDTAGVQLLLFLHRKMEGNVTLQFVNVGPSVNKVLSFFGVDKKLTLGEAAP